MKRTDTSVVAFTDKYEGRAENLRVVAMIRSGEFQKLEIVRTWGDSRSEDRLLILDLESARKLAIMLHEIVGAVDEELVREPVGWARQ